MTAHTFNALTGARSFGIISRRSSHICVRQAVLKKEVEDIKEEKLVRCLPLTALAPAHSAFVLQKAAEEVHFRS